MVPYRISKIFRLSKIVSCKRCRLRIIEDLWRENLWNFSSQDETPSNHVCLSSQVFEGFSADFTCGGDEVST
jgi:hypothetical protein